jgi:bifunctional non-homologous end joining protein LigD
MSSRFIVHQHKAGRSHFDLRVLQNGVLRSWSLLKEPPRRRGERRLAVERESYTAESIDSSLFEEEAFGRGPVVTWDKGEVEIKNISPRHFSLVFSGSKVEGKYEFHRMLWYPGNRWLLVKM